MKACKLISCLIERVNSGKTSRRGGCIRLIIRSMPQVILGALLSLGHELRGILYHPVQLLNGFGNLFE